MTLLANGSICMWCVVGFTPDWEFMGLHTIDMGPDLVWHGFTLHTCVLKRDTTSCRTLTLYDLIIV